ncbi:MAG: hypothetical protein Q8N10_17140 [Phenylobacterium sp.]|uniref:hypothetical protein n=1 Tax=Phenylobacterium sp. TaxID=1871053 RepID=UPI0027158996|nr:hypothetical protein [Phenylobacterium sp.]MDO8911800.1 hypothetical protein [Phenylobacterium sp.]MDP3102214.1 hypothetical protein [Phenylobacterium sp.]
MVTPRQIADRLSDIRTSGGNEADTRFKVIDDILTSILGWDKTDFTLEERVSEDGADFFLDYLITTAQTSLLIEAKRAQIDFSKLPQARRAPLKGSWVKGDIKKAIHQARDYGRKLGVGFCAVTNGDAWIIFPINRRDLVTFEDTHAVIFSDAEEALDTDFEDFFSLLARDEVIDGSLEQGLLGGDSNQTENRRLNRIYDHSFSKIARTTMFSSIEDEIVTSFSEELVAENSELLEKAYVETADRMRFDDRVKMAVLRREQVVNTRPMRPVGRTGVRAASEHVLTTRVRSQPVALLTLGLVGAGKTTFLRYVEKVSGKEFFQQQITKPKSHWLYIDFRSYSRAVAPRSFIYDSIFEYIGQNPTLGDFDASIKGAYEAEISALTRGPLAIMKGNQAAIDEKIAAIIMKEYEEKAPYCKRILTHSSKKTPIFLVIDNVDQIESSETQESIFLEAVAIARESGLNLVLAMRDATYVKNKSSAVFDAFTFDAIYIDPPHIQSVLSKRFAIAEHLLRGKKFELTTEGGAKVEVTDASRVVEMLSASVLGTEVGQLIEVAATGDVRLALQMTKQFLQFGYSTSYKSYLVFQRRGRYVFPVHEAIRAIMFGNQSIYRDEFSPLINPFDAKTGRSESQFLRIYIMNALVSAASTKTFQGLEAGEIVSSLEKMGFSQRITNKVIHDLIRARVCFSRSHQDYTLDSVLVPTRLCGYIARDLVSRMVFLETVIFDTFIYDDPVWAQVKTAMKTVYSEHRPVEKFRKRKEIAKIFFDWCEQEVNKLCNEAGRRNLGPFWTNNPISRLKVDFDNELDRAFRSAVRNYGSQKDKELMGMPLFQDPQPRN